MADASSYFDDVKKYTSSFNEAACTKIVRHLGIALRNRDSSLVSCSDKTELDRVREKWCRKKLELPHTDAELDAVIQSVCDMMKEDRTKSRVTFYYLVAEKTGKLGMLAG